MGYCNAPFCSILSSTIWYKITNVYGWFEESLSLGNNSFVRENRGLLWNSLLLSKTFDTGRQLAGLLRRTLGTLSGWAWLPARNRYRWLHEEKKRWLDFMENRILRESKVTFFFSKPYLRVHSPPKSGTFHQSDRCSCHCQWHRRKVSVLMTSQKQLRRTSWRLW